MLPFSFYKNGITNKIPNREISLERAVELIKGDTYKADIERLRSSGDPSIRAVVKKGLDYFTFSGTFKKRLTDSLIQHSGLICLDFDDLEDLPRIQYLMPLVPWVAACFVSPSGTGLKVIIPIDGTYHQEAFQALEKVFKSDYAIEVDKSGKDVTRACFVSHDPEIYYNPNAEQFVFDIESWGSSNIYPEKITKLWEKQLLPASQKFERDKHLARILYCVEQIERDKIDITSDDYDDRLLVGFALSTLGEDARELYHRAVQYNDAYSPQDADDKFTNALTTSKFKTPAKFYTLCKNFNIQTSEPKTIAQKKDEADYKELIGNDANADDYLKYGIWENNGTYWSLNLKNKAVEISNFNLRILYHVETSDEEAYRLIEIKNIHGHKAVVKMNTDDFVSVGSFKKVVARKGNFIFKGGEPELCRLQDKLQREERPTKLVKQLGWNRRGKFYAFANGIYDVTLDQFLTIDEYGIVEHRISDGAEGYTAQNYFIPALSKIFSEKEDMFANDKKFILKQSSITFQVWAEQYCKVFGKQGEVALVFYLVAIYSDIIFRDMGRRLPLLNVYGKRGTGKGALIGSLLRLFGEGQDQLMLGGASTAVGFMRKFAQFSNAIVWLDEYKNNLKANFIESLKNIYDRIGYERGKKDNTFQTESTPILSACILSGQEMPTIEPALFTRNILLSLTVTKHTESEKEQYRKLASMEEAGLSGITIYLMKHRPVIEDQFKHVFVAEQKSLIKELNNNEVDDRMISNYASIMAVAEIFDSLEAMPFNRLKFKELCRHTLLEQFYILKGSDDASKFWDIVETVFTEGRIKEGEQFQLRNGYLYLRVQDIYQHYAETLQKRKDPNMLDKATLEKYLESDPKSFIARERRMFGGAQKWCFVFKYAELGVDLIKANTPEELKSKYLEMNIEYVDETERVSLANDAKPDDLPF